MRDTSLTNSSTRFPLLSMMSTGQLASAATEGLFKSIEGGCHGRTENVGSAAATSGSTLETCAGTNTVPGPAPVATGFAPSCAMNAWTCGTLGFLGSLA